MSPLFKQALTSDPFEDEEEALFSGEDKSAAPVSKGANREGFGSRPRIDPKDFPSFESPYPTKGRRLPWQNEKLWLHTAHAFGYIAPRPGQAELPIYPLSSIRPDGRLKRGRITLTLDRLRIKSYPGRGIHRVLTHFYAQNQTPETKEDLHFNAMYRVREGEEAALRGYPIFVGLSVGSIGIRLRVRSINVCNDQDEAFLSVLESDVIRSGLHLAATAQPVIAPFSQLAFSIAKAVGERHRNIPVQDFDLGLDFGTSPTGARLAAGSYLAVQMPHEHLMQWDWKDWMYHADSGLILLRTDYRLALPYNYFVFSIHHYKEGA